MYACEADLREHIGTPRQPIECLEKPSHYGHRHPVAVIPCATAREARALVKFANMGEEEQADKIAHSIQPVDAMSGTYPEMARAVLAAIYGRASK
jgi:hypothetical protein